MSQRVESVVVGGGQAGLAVSWHLTRHAVEHVVLEQGGVGHRWARAGWDSLRLVTPNWMSRLPGWAHHGSDPDGFRSAPELLAYLRGYADSFGAPVLTGTTVWSVRRAGDRFRVDTDRASWSARTVVVATGACGTPDVPALAAGLPATIAQLTAGQYRNPDVLPEGAVMVVGASASGTQIARELHRSGRQVVLSAGGHTRVPRSYRGRDIWWWLDALGRLDRSVEDQGRPDRAQREASLQLVGRAGEDIDLGLLAAEGLQVTGRLTATGGRRVHFAPDLTRTTFLAEARHRRLLDAMDSYVSAHDLHAQVAAVPRYRRVQLEPGVREIDLSRAGIRVVIWATGYRSHLPWLRLPVLDGAGHIRHRGGVTPEPGVYTVGQPFGRRNSTLLDGVRHDAAAVVGHLTGGGRLGLGVASAAAC